MSCYNPRWAEPYPFRHPKYGQFRLLPVTRSKVHEYAVDPDTGQYLQAVRVPCGKCVGCRLDYSRDWASRISMESLDYPDNSLFVTLTYDDDHLPIMIDDGTQHVLKGKGFSADYVTKGATLLKKDCQDWLKRLRRNLDYHYGISDGVRYYLAGEYGSNTLRPHYHVCLFGVPTDSLVPIGKNKLGDILYDSDFISDTWKQGHVCVGKLNYATAAYTARYCLKKAQGKDDAFFDSVGVNREFVTMSRKPGIGVPYYEAHKEDIYKNDEIVLPAQSKDKKNVIKPPRYFDILYKAENPLEMAKIKLQRGIVAEMHHDNVMAATDLDEIDYYAVQERKKSESIKKLIREL